MFRAWKGARNLSENFCSAQFPGQDVTLISYHFIRAATIIHICDHPCERRQHGHNSQVQMSRQYYLDAWEPPWVLTEA